MSKLDRSEFKKLITEWRNNFINERTTPDLSKHITGPKQNFTIIQVAVKKPSFREKLAINNIEFGFVGNIIVECDKEGNKIKDFIVNNFILDKVNKALLDESYDKEDPILVASSIFSGDFGEGQTHSKEECLNWLIHDFFHANFDHGRLGLSGFLDYFDAEIAEEYLKKYKTLFSSSNYNFKDIDLDNLMDHGEEFTSDIYSYDQGKKHEHVIPEILSYFNSINFTAGIESFDLIPSIFSYCLIKMPHPDDIVNLTLLFNKSGLSDEAKMYLLIFNTVARQSFNDITKHMKNKVLFLDLN